jgi:hypothetical protein
MFDKNNTMIQGHLKIHDPNTGEILVDKSNAIHYENMSDALARSLGNKGTGTIFQMVFGNGATAIDSTGVVTYLPTKTNVSDGRNADLYNQTYAKVVDNTSPLNSDSSRNYVEIRHTDGKIYTDIFISCLLDYSEPAGQQAFDNSPTLSGEYVFDELGILSDDPYTIDGTQKVGRLLTHVIFHPVQKALNRLIQIDYTIRIQSLTNLTSNA